MKRYCLALLFGLNLVLWYRPVFSAIGDIDAKQGSGVYNNIDMWRIDQNGIVYFSTSSVSAGVTINPATGISLSSQKNITTGPGGDFVYGSLTVSLSTTATSGSSNGTIYTVTMGAGANSPAALEGSLLCAMTPVGNTTVIVSSVCNAAVGIANFIGVAAAAASTGSVVNVYSDGVVLALTTGTVVAGDILGSSALSAGVLQVTQSTMPIVGIALGPGTASGGLTRIKIK